MATLPRSFPARVARPVAGSAVVVLLLAGGAVLVIRPGLQRARSLTASQWVALRPLLDERFGRLHAAVGAIRPAFGADAGPLAAADAAVISWERLRRIDARAGSSVDDEVAAANEAESAASRVRTFVAADARLLNNPAIVSALVLLTRTDPGDARSTYDRAVHAYEASRRGVFKRLLAGALGYRARATLETP